MEDSKISELTELAEIAADDDVFGLVDTSASETKKHSMGYVRRSEVRAITASGAQGGAGASDLHVALESATATNYTVSDAPTVGDKLSAIVDTTAAHTIVLSGSVTFDGTNQTANLATALDSFYAVARSATRWDIVSNNGVTLSA